MDILEASRLDTAANWLADHPRLTALLLIAAILIAGQLENSSWL